MGLYPSIRIEYAYRCNQSGTKDPSGTYINIKVHCQNCSTAQAVVKESTIGGSSATHNINVNAETIIPNISKTKSYIVNAYGFNSDGEKSYPSSINIPTAETSFSVKSGGRGVAFGQYAEYDNRVVVNSNWDFYVGGKNIKPKIIGGSHGSGLMPDYNVCYCEIGPVVVVNIQNASTYMGRIAGLPQPEFDLYFPCKSGYPYKQLFGHLDTNGRLTIVNSQDEEQWEEEEIYMNFSYIKAN